NGKKLARIRTDYVRESYVHEAAADLNLGALEDAEHPDNAPICPLMFVDGTRKAYVTVRGGGLYVVDTQATPMRVIKEFGRSQIAPAGCGGVVVGNKVYINSGTANSSDLYVFDARTDALLKHLSLTDTGTDAHGMLLTGGGRYLWVANRANGDNVVVIDTVRDEVVGIIPNVGSAPDLIDAAPGALAQSRCEPATTAMCLAPGGTRAFISVRPPNPLTGGPAAAGEQTGISVVSIAEGGRTGSQLFFVPVGDTNADIHALAVRLTAATSAARLPATGAGEALGAGKGLWGAAWGGAALLSAVAAIGVRRWIVLRQQG
ncbi:MAG TPA: hypothetical protein VGW38_19625, partial [Chloroflexota bacterium]|nr:hypothetical protein [Chloroflexota bacterium]